MAAPSKQDEIHTTRFKERLIMLDCPYSEGMLESAIADMFLSPGEPRIQLLQWLFTRFDSKLNDVLDPQFASSESKMESRLQRLLYLTSSLGLCRYDDVDLIRGATSKSRQAAFLDQLLDFVCIVDAAEDPQTKSMCDPSVVSEAHSLDDQFSYHCQNMDKLASQQKLAQMFDFHVNLLPPVISHQVKNDWKKKGYTKDLPPSPSEQTLKEKHDDIMKNLSKQADILEEVMKSYKYQVVNESDLEKLSRTMTLALSDLSQLAVEFGYCFDNDLRHFCHRTAPRLTQLGPTVKRVHTMLQHYDKLLRGLESIKTSHSRLENELPSKIQDLTKDMKTLKQSRTNQGAVANFQLYSGVLGESANRLQTSQRSPSKSIMSDFSKIEL